MRFKKPLGDLLVFTIIASIGLGQLTGAQEKGRSDAADKQTVKEEDAGIGVEATKPATSHTLHPDAQWFPDAGLGLFLHWGISSVRGMNISWPMIPGRPLATKKVSAEERARIIRESDYNLDGKPPQITPNQYWSMAAFFNPKRYNPDHWLKAAKTAGFTYAVLTTRHHEGFALWPSAYGHLNTKLLMGSRDLLKDYVAACRRNGLKVGFYYSPPDWFFDRDYMNFLYDRHNECCCENSEFSAPKARNVKAWAIGPGEID